MKKAIITGISGQDGAYLAKTLLKLNYSVFGIYRYSSTPNFWRLDELGIKNDIQLDQVSITDYSTISNYIKELQPDEIYNLAAVSFVPVSFLEVTSTFEINLRPVINILNAIRDFSPKTKFYQASTSEMYGKVVSIPQNETTTFHPRSPYAISKLAAHNLVINYREAYNLFCVSGILFNHESPIRTEDFVTRKISKSIAEIYAARRDFLEIGNLDSCRDWGYAEDYVDGMRLMLQQDVAQDFVLATNQSVSIRKFIEMAASVLDISIEWSGTGTNEVGIDKKNGKKIIKVNKRFFRPAEVDYLQGDPSKASNILGWKPTIFAKDLARIMVLRDLERLKN